MEKAGVKEQVEFAILTAEISKATFGMTPSEYKAFKDLDGNRQEERRPGFIPNKTAAKEGGTVAGNARRDLEKKTGAKISTSENYKELPKIARRKMKTIKPQD